MTPGPPPNHEASRDRAVEAGHAAFLNHRAASPSGFPMMHRMLRPLASTLLRLVAGVMLGGTLVACAMTPERLPNLDRKFYYNLPSENDKAAFLKVQDTQRQAFLEQKGLWALWAELSNEERAAVGRGEVKVGQKEFVAFMVWGPPADSKGSKSSERTVRFHTFIRCSSGPRAGEYVHSNLDCDGTSSESEIAVENNTITEIKFLN